MKEGETFIIGGTEYMIIKIKGSKITAKKIGEGEIPFLFSTYLIGDTNYKITYVNTGLQFINLQRIEKKENY